MNTLHRNGVKVLGTFLIEPQTLHVERLFEQRDGEFMVSEKLAAIAETYGFDGWLVNVEGEMPDSITNPLQLMTDMIRSLKAKMRPSSTVIWYDGLTSANEVDYQNGLTSKNVACALEAGNLFTNYKWTRTHLDRSTEVAEKYGMDRENVYFGIDVWAQNTTSLLGHKRVTFPPHGGGGTNTGVVNLTFLLLFIESIGFSVDGCYRLWKLWQGRVSRQPYLHQPGHMSTFPFRPR